MDKNEYKVRLEEIRNQIDQENYAEAAAIADQIEWKKVRNVNTLCMISEVYESVDRFEDSKTLLLRAYRRSPMSRTVLYRLVEVTTTLKQFDEAIGYYSEYVQAAPHDTNRYILKYKIYRGRGSSVNEQIEILKEYLDQEYNEQYAYELALLYKEADRMQECIAACDDLVLWFHSGKYVIKALELKRRYAVLTPKQQEIYDARFAMEDMDRELAELGKEKQMVDTDETTLADSIMEDTERAIAEMVSKAAKEGAETAAEETAEAVEETVETAAEEAAEAAEETAETAVEEAADAAEETAAAAEEAAETAAEEAAEATEETAAAAEEAAETAAKEAAEAAEDTAAAVEETAETAAEEAAEAAEETAAAVEETAEIAVEEVAEAAEETAAAVEETAEAAEETAETAAEEAAEEVVGAAPESLLPAQPKSREELQSDIAKDMRDIIGNVGRMEYIDENEQALDDLIEESKKDQVREREKLRMPSLRMPDLQKKQAAGKLTIDDILLSMGERGDAVREAVAKNTPYNNAAPGVLSAVDEALLNMGITPAGSESKADAEESVSEPAKKDYSSEMKEIILPAEETSKAPEKDAGKEEKTEEASVKEESAPVSEDVREAEVKHSTLSNEELEAALFGKEKEGDESFRDKTMEEIITAKTRRLPTEEIARRYGSIPVSGISEPEEDTPQEQTDTTDEAALEEAKQDEAVSEAEDGGTAAQAQKEEQVTEERPEQQEKTPAEEPRRPVHTGPQLKEDLRELFDGFLNVRGLEGQIVYAIRQALAKGNDRTSRTGNILIFGAHGAGKTTLAMALAKAIAQERGQGYVKMARIYSTDLNRKDIAATVAKIAGGVLIVEEAGDLDDGIADQLTTAMEFRTDGLIVILEDERMYIHELLMRHPRLTMKFTSEIYLPAYTPEELAGFGEVYADEKDFAVSDASREVLISKITAMTENEDPRQPLSITAVKEVMDRAMIRASGFGRKLFGGKKRYDSEGRIILKEKDFS